MTRRADREQAWGNQDDARSAHDPQAPSRDLPSQSADEQFEALFRDSYGRVRRWARNYGVEDGDIEDVAQEVFVIAHRRREGGIDRSWLYGVTRRVCSTHRRGDRRREQRREKVAWSPAPISEADPDASVERRRRAERFGEFLTTLPESMRHTFQLHILDGLDPASIAELTQTSREAVYTRIRRAKARFGEWLAKENQDSEDHRA